MQCVSTQSKFVMALDIVEILKMNWTVLLLNALHSVTALNML